MKIDTVHNKSCRSMSELADNSIDQMVTDPPYAIGFMGKAWDKFQKKKPTASQVVSWMSPTMKKDTRGMMEFFTPIWRECLRVLKPGAFAFVMCIPRQDCLARMVVSLEDAGFNISFSPIFHAFAQGFPKAQNISKVVDKRLGAKRKVIGQKIRGDVEKAKKSGTTFAATDANRNNRDIFGYGVEDITLPATPQAQALDGSYSYNPKPAVEIVIVAQKPKTAKTYVDQALLWYEERQGVLRGLAIQLEKCYNVGKVEWES